MNYDFMTVLIPAVLAASAWAQQPEGVATCPAKGDTTASNRLANQEYSLKCRLEAVGELRKEASAESVDGLARGLDLKRNPVDTRAGRSSSASTRPGFATYGGRNKLLGAYPAADAIVSLGREKPEMVTARLRAALRDQPMSAVAIHNAGFTLFLIHADNPAEAVRALRAESAVAPNAERRAALDEEARAWADRCPAEKKGGCAAALVEEGQTVLPGIRPPACAGLPRR